MHVVTAHGVSYTERDMSPHTRHLNWKKEGVRKGPLFLLALSLQSHHRLLQKYSGTRRKV